ncbi:hypothetical protein [Streptomyces sp. BE133]|uniref:hypothetical protein n=1 Tax=Streptomyces sp. BE133 TaxID=3002523 RepID=UPI002E7A861C|nr:hypothetical protein [Streptomyces sp. BE133]
MKQSSLWHRRRTQNPVSQTAPQGIPGQPRAPAVERSGADAAQLYWALLSAQPWSV